MSDIASTFRYNDKLESHDTGVFNIAKDTVFNITPIRTRYAECNHFYREQFIPLYEYELAALTNDYNERSPVAKQKSYEFNEWL